MSESIDVLVTGSSSRLGGYVVARLVRRGLTVAGVARSDMAAARTVGAGARAIRGDLLDPHLDVPRCRTLIHLAGITTTPRAIQLLEKAGAGRVIVTSSASAAVPGHPRELDVLRLERYWDAVAAAESVVLRPTMIFGAARDSNVRLLWEVIRRLRFAPVVGGGAQVQPIFVDDLATIITEAALVPTLAASDSLRTVAGESPISLGDLVTALAGAAGIRQVPVPVSVRPAIALARAVPASRTTRLVHALAMLGADRSAPQGSTDPWTAGRTALEVALRTAVDRYRTGVDGWEREAWQE